jgi:adhesin HecA-like repeat protein
MKNDSEFKRRIRDAIRLANRNGFVGTEQALRLLANDIEGNVADGSRKNAVIGHPSIKHIQSTPPSRGNEAAHKVH